MAAAAIDQALRGDHPEVVVVSVPGQYKADAPEDQPESGDDPGNGSRCRRGCRRRRGAIAGPGRARSLLGRRRRWWATGKSSACLRMPRTRSPSWRGKGKLLKSSAGAAGCGGRAAEARAATLPATEVAEAPPVLMRACWWQWARHRRVLWHRRWCRGVRLRVWRCRLVRRGRLVSHLRSFSAAWDDSSSRQRMGPAEGERISDDSGFAAYHQPSL